MFKLIGLIKGNFLKIIYSIFFSKIRLHGIKCIIPFNSHIRFSKNSLLICRKNIQLGEYCRIKIRKNATLKIGDDFFMNDGSQITCHKQIHIGNNVELGQNVLIFDHDHDYKNPLGLKAQAYNSTNIEIGNNVWIGAGSIILRGTIIGDNCVIAAGSVIKGVYENNSIIIKKGIEEVKYY